MSESDMIYDNHNGDVSCNIADSVHWSGNEMTISYLGQRKTCYARTKAMNLLFDQVPIRGMISANIKITDKGCNASTIWPAFWLVASKHGVSWPGCGEIDMAERQQGETRTHLIGASQPGDAFSANNMVSYGDYPSSALQPDGTYHKYGFEWRYLNADAGKQVAFTAWFDGKWMGTHFCDEPGTSGQELTCHINYHAFQDGYHFPVFDADTHNHADKYSMSIKDVKIESIPDSAVV